jgi:hypothetical protein
MLRPGMNAVRPRRRAAGTVRPEYDCSKPPDDADEL